MSAGSGVRDNDIRQRGESVAASSRKQQLSGVIRHQRDVRQRRVRKRGSKIIEIIGHNGRDAKRKKNIENVKRQEGRHQRQNRHQASAVAEDILARKKASWRSWRLENRHAGQYSVIYSWRKGGEERKSDNKAGERRRRRISASGRRLMQ